MSTRVEEVFARLTGDVPEVVYHYCGPDGLLGILQSRHIWATSARHLKDTSERIFAVDLVRSAARRLARKASTDSESLEAIPAALRMLIQRVEEDTSYVACFSEHADLLSQWRAYAPQTGGFSIGIYASSIAWGGGWLFGRCEYDRASQAEAVESILQDHPKFLDPSCSLDQLIGENDPELRSLIAALLTLVPLLKHPGFSEEAEWRIVRGIEAGDHPTEFRVSRGAVIPFQRIYLAGDTGRLPIAEVVIGPSLDARDQTYSATRVLLDQHGLQSCDVRISQISYRGW